MSFSLSAAQWANITAFQTGEIERLANEAAFASSMAFTPHYSRIGAWLTPSERGERVLEIGCGPGRYVAMLGSLGFDVVGADPQRYPAWEIIEKAKPVVLQEGVSAESLPYSSKSFDAVACMGALLYFRDDKAALSEMRRVLKPNGKLVVRTVSRGNLYRRVWRRNIDPATVNVYTEDELAALLRDSGFTVAETFSYGFYPPVLIEKWWRLVNGIISVERQQALSRLCPPGCRVNVIAFATRNP